MIKRIVRPAVVALVMMLSLTACSDGVITKDQEANDTERLEVRGFTKVIFLSHDLKQTQYEVSYGSCRLVIGLPRDGSHAVELGNIDGVLSETHGRDVSATVLDKYDYFNDCRVQTSSTSSQEPSTDTTS